MGPFEADIVSLAIRRAEEGSKVYLETGIPLFSYLEVEPHAQARGFLRRRVNCNGKKMRIKDHKYPAPSLIWKLTADYAVIRQK